MTLVIVQLSAKSERFSKLHAELAGAARAKAGGRAYSIAGGCTLDAIDDPAVGIA